ncbi:MAG: hypothetical protein CMJ85_04460 [Planctomycetes bacterium]|nr:hypothetical protein [Planctomycetota bacterium]
MRTPIVLGLFLTVAVGAALRAQTHAPTRVANDSIRLDGVLGEQAWKDAPLLRDLVQVEPIEGVPPSRRTDVRICYDDQHFYLAILCHDNPGEVRARVMERDARLDPDDRCEWWIDTFHDRRFAFWFQVGAGGSRGDALISSNGDRFNKSWDGIWDARVRRTKLGWQAEIAIPFKTLAFKRGAGTWGFNFVRHRKVNEEEMRWASPLVAYRFFRISRGGTLTGLTGINQGLGLDVVPYVKSSVSRDRRVSTGASVTGDAGGELYYRITPELRFVLTFRTDFAETEVDKRQVNLTRFPLFFPEKRGFFLEDAGLFEFGIPRSRRGGGSSRGSLMPFFSRRIGLSEADETAVPILTGGKLTGRVDEWNVGLLGTALDEHGDQDRRAVGVARISRNIGDESSVGMIVTAGDPNSDARAFTGGVDFKLGDSEFFGNGRALRFWGYALGTSTEGAGGDDFAFGGRGSYQAADFSQDVSVSSVGERFDPRLGFVPRTGHSLRGTSRLTWRGDGEGMIRTARVSVSPSMRMFTNGDTESWRVTVNWLDLEFESGDRIDIDLFHGFERIPDAFEVHSGIFVPAADYDYTRHRLFVQTSNKRMVECSGRVEVGDLYSGQLLRWSVEATVRPCPLITVAAQYEEFRVSLDEGDFTARLGQARLDAAFSPDLSLRSLLQYDTDTRNLSVQSRLRWTIEPGRDLFLLGVFGWEKASDDAPLVSTTQDVTIKLAYSTRF